MGVSGFCVHSILPCKAKRQYLLTLQVSRYCLLALQSGIDGLSVRLPSAPGFMQTQCFIDRI